MPSACRGYRGGKPVRDNHRASLAGPGMARLMVISPAIQVYERTNRSISRPQTIYMELGITSMVGNCPGHFPPPNHRRLYARPFRHCPDSRAYKPNLEQFTIRHSRVNAYVASMYRLGWPASSGTSSRRLSLWRRSYQACQLRCAVLRVQGHVYRNTSGIIMTDTVNSVNSVSILQGSLFGGEPQSRPCLAS